MAEAIAKREPFKFVPAFEFPRDPTLFRKEVNRRCQIASCRCSGFAHLNENGRVDIYNLQDPAKTNVWYLIDGAGWLGAAFNLITDGEVYYPVTRITASANESTVVRIATNFKKRSMSTELSTDDQKLIKEAINYEMARQRGEQYPTQQ